VIDWLQKNPRRVWWTTFALVTCLTGLWGLADPLFAGPDEPAHVIRADSLDHGQLTGKTPSLRLLKELKGDKASLMVRAPEIYKWIGTPCFAFQPDTPAKCLHVEGSRRRGDALTTAGRHPPAYYAVVGVASLMLSPGSGTVYIMRLITALITGAFIATAVTALRRTSMPEIAGVGLLLGITPMVLFVGSLVNPSAPEIAASFAVWASGLVLLSRAHERVDKRLVTAFGIAASVLALSRSLGPLWLGLIGVTLLLSSASKASLWALVRSRWAQLWAVVVVACCLGQVGWSAVVKPLDYTRSGKPPLNIPISEVVRTTLGVSFSRYREMIGLFGWQDTPSPILTYLVWTAGIGLLVFLAMAAAKRRQVAALVILLAGTIVVPVALESNVYRDARGFAWQGRYTLPFAIGIPILAAFVLASSERARQLVQPRLLVALGGSLAIAHVLAFTQNLRRYTVGYNGALQYWKNPRWSPPLGPFLLTVIYSITIVVFVAWMLSLKRSRAQAVPREAPEHPHETAHLEPSAPPTPVTRG
jgi:hypothetical protein